MGLDQAHMRPQIAVGTRRSIHRPGTMSLSVPMWGEACNPLVVDGLTLEMQTGSVNETLMQKERINGC